MKQTRTTNRPVPRTLMAWLLAAFLVGVTGCGKSGSDAPAPPDVESPATTGDASTSPPQSKPATETSPVTEIPPTWLSSEEIAAGWIQLFDGASLFGWEASNDVNWSVEKGVITADSGEPGLLLTTVRYRDYELKCDFRLEKGGNSGIFLRTAREPKDPAIDCYELNICDSHPAFPTGSLVGRRKPDREASGEGDWKTFYVKMEGRHIVVELDGEPLLDFTDDSEHRRDVGRIGLQKNEGRIEFRNIALRPLGAQPLFNGADLSGWNVVPGSQGSFSVENGAIRAQGGPGFLETTETYGDFILQCEARTKARELNSGIFFRAMKGTEENPSGGYELQIHNGFADGDRSQPNDYGTGFGTGAIFRLAKARYVAADDLEWFSMTLVADGPRFATFVNGRQVVAFEDVRPANENPRRGRRVEPGHISLQGHDPATDVEFRNLSVFELGQ